MSDGTRNHPKLTEIDTVHHKTGRFSAGRLQILVKHGTHVPSQPAPPRGEADESASRYASLHEMSGCNCVLCSEAYETALR